MKRRIFVTFFLLLMAARLAACGSADTPPGVTPYPAQTPTGTDAPVMRVLTATPTLAVAKEPTFTPQPSVVVPTPTPIPLPPTPTPHLYAVQQYDTLLGLALEFDTSIEVLVAANGLNENDFLQIGQKLIIPAPGQVMTPTIAAKPKATIVVTSTAPISKTTLVTATPVLSQVEQNQPTPSPLAVSTAAVVASSLPTFSHPANINPLTGLTVDDPATLQRRPLLVRVGNDPAARPQVGLNSADMVYEEIAEWWITRFTAIFLAETPTTVGPVRSARLINVQLVPQYQGALAHSGGSDPVRWEISQAPLVNLDEFYNRSPYFYRPNEGWQTRLSLNAVSARDYMQKKGFESPVSLQGFLFSNTVEGGESGENIYVPYPRVTSLTEWHYNPASGQYLRWVSGQPLNDFNGGQIAASNVIIYFADHQATDIIEDTNNATSIRIIVNGKGAAWFFRDGKLNKGSWETDGSRTPYFAYEDGRPYALKPGRTWVEVAPTYFTIGLNSFDEASAKPQ
jgi:LysM repeat protein